MTTVSSYEVAVCDRNPTYDLTGGLNVIRYKFSSRRKAINFLKECVSQGHHVVINMFDVEKIEHTGKGKKNAR